MASLDELIGNDEASLSAEYATLKKTRSDILTGGQGVKKKDFQVDRARLDWVNTEMRRVEASMALLKVNEL